LLTELNHGRGIHTVEGTDFTIRRNDGSELDIDLSGAVTVDDLLARINDHPDNQDSATAVLARMSPIGNGIEIVDDNPPGESSLTIIRNEASEAALDLGLIPPGESQAVAGQLSTKATASITSSVPNTSLNIEAVTGGTNRNDIQIVFENTLAGDAATATFDPNSRQLTIALDATQTTANTVAQAITDQGIFSASLATATDPTNTGNGLIANGVVGFPAAVAQTGGGTADTLTSTDRNPLETNSTFNTLLRLRNALESNDFREIERSVANLDKDLDRVNFIRGDLGAKEQSLDTLTARLDNEEVELRGTLSLEIEVDLVEAISQLTARQASAEASLRVMGRLSGLTLLNFI
jgi:flagellin-like hook-associated protein FlgL